jgi:hypothetical protein
MNADLDFHMCRFAELCILPGGAELLSFNTNSDDSNALYSAKRQDHPAVTFYYDCFLQLFLYLTCFQNTLVLRLRSSFKADKSNICQ